MSSISALLKDLSATLGAEVVRAEAMKFFSQQAESQEAQEGQEGQEAQGGKEKKPKKEKKEVKPRGPSEWNLYCRQVLEQMKKENPSATPKMAMMAAKESWAQKKASQVEADPTVAEKIALLKEKRASLETQIQAVEAQPSERSDTNVWVEEKKAKTKKASQASGAGGGAEAAAEPLDPVEDERRKVFKYLFTLQASGSTNMMAAGSYLQGQFSFSSGQAEAYVLEYISSYQALKAKYN
jgi:hypothetical protein